MKNPVNNTTTIGQRSFYVGKGLGKDKPDILLGLF